MQNKNLNSSGLCCPQLRRIAPSIVLQNKKLQHWRSPGCHRKKDFFSGSIIYNIFIIKNVKYIKKVKPYLG